MSDQIERTKAILTWSGAIAALVALVAMFAIMSDCSKHVADVEANPQKACLEGGGFWAHPGAPNGIGHCEKAAK